MSIRSNRRRYALPVLALALAAASTAQAGWWIFGKAKGRPEMTGLYIGGVSLGQSDAKMSFYRNHLKEGRLEVKGFFRSPKSAVAEAKLSLDGGQSWVEKEKIALANDSFIYSFEPKPEQDYDVRASVLDTKGQESDSGDLTRVVFVYHEKSGEDVANAGLLELANQYMARDQRGFNALISPDYQGDRGSLEDAVARDFREFREIKLSMIPSRTLLNGADAKIDFRYDVSRLSASGSTVNKDSGLATYTLRLEGNQYKLLQMPRPIIFGVSAPASDNPILGGGGDAATTVVSGSGQVKFETSTFDFAAGRQSATVDISATMQDLSTEPPGGIQLIGSTPLNNVKEAPASGYSQDTSGVLNGSVYAVKTQAGKFALLQVTSVSGAGTVNFTVNFNYLFQTDGSRTFSQ